MNGLFFDKSHTWAYMEKDGLVKIGMDDFLQHVVGSITQMEMKKPGETIKKGEPLISLIQKGKKLTINAPVSGIIKEQNDELLYDSSLVNSAPYGEGWMYLIEPTNWSKEIPFLLMGEKYSIWLKNEFSRLKDFLASYVKPNSESYSPVVMQDGGELRDKLLSGLGPEVWEEFQTNFINTSK
jgi:glycine cleavage system H lipoate-binding protein